LWGKTAEEFSDDTQPVLAVKGVKVSDFNGKSLSCLSSSALQINPDLQEAHALRGWYDNEGANLTSQSLSNTARGGGAAPWKLAVEANEVTSSDMEKADIFMCKATLMAIKGDNSVYKACITEKCNKKVVDLGNGMYKCEKCNKEHPSCKPRVMLSCHFADFTDHFWATCFHETSEAILGQNGDVLGDMYDNRREEYDQLIKNALFQEYIGKFRSKMENYNNEMRKKVTVLELNPINHAEYAKQLLNDIRECSS
jgi:replication factor A1